MGEEEDRPRLRMDGRGGALHRDHDARAHRRRCKRALDRPCGSSKAAGGTNHGRCFTSGLTHDNMTWRWTTTSVRFGKEEFKG